MCSVADQISPDARRHFRGDRTHGCADDVSDEISWVWRPEHQQSLREPMTTAKAASAPTEVQAWRTTFVSAKPAGMNSTTLRSHGRSMCSDSRQSAVSVSHEADSSPSPHWVSASIRATSVKAGMRAIEMLVSAATPNEREERRDHTNAMDKAAAASGSMAMSTY